MPTTTTVITTRADLIEAFTSVTRHSTFRWNGIDLDVVREGPCRTVTFPDHDTDFGVLTYNGYLHSVLELIRDLEFIAEAVSERHAR